MPSVSDRHTADSQDVWQWQLRRRERERLQLRFSLSGSSQTYLVEVMVAGLRFSAQKLSPRNASSLQVVFSDVPPSLPPLLV